MLAGFLHEIRRYNVKISCCSPYNLKTLAHRFPEIEWLPYTEQARDNAIQTCDVWLGLGGSPFQSDVSDWFIKHLQEECQKCSNYQKPMYFLGIGGQDEKAYQNPSVKLVIDQSEKLWVRDEFTLQSVLKLTSDKSKVILAEDLAHIFFQENLLPAPKKGRISVTLNFDFQNWVSLNKTLISLESLRPSERIWLIQENRRLIGAEKWLYSTLSEDQQSCWNPVDINQEGSSLTHIGAIWPSSEWVLTSRFHTTLASAWAGSKIAVVATNLKLSAVAKACGIQALDPLAPTSNFLDALERAQPVAKSHLIAKAEMSRRSVNDFATLLDL